MNIIMNGSGGRMGAMMATIVAEREKDRIVAGIDPKGRINAEPFPVFESLEACDVDADVLIDFSGAEAVPTMISFLQKRHVPVVVATTGLSDENMTALKTLAETSPVFQAANMSLGINLIRKLAAQAAQALGDAFDIEIIEKHHNQKKDAPSGTALALADSVNEARDGELHYVFGRRESAKKREASELGIHAIRGGTIVGEHDVLFAGIDEVITISHSAYSRRVFAAGAMKAAAYIVTKTSGFFTMDDLISGR
ncbi:4-hydroxy-tetrahydrodipicolinate reductase [Sediminispirochaeta smaragdinae]|uniref:4-hydroxy-tetrahydrodipicolinate reductase n=1 Tax=Sediminispirochaeta smaragdinae (strain DSM 11293 / JCM 15392 / SEBR 4228) TaxID=573413 RepID=E1R5I7_SEDSS|nr:4-hydroxy-tetrahydrodipicolinate reductase [Sediminispirochaeta smaragdinae]ADK82315.1 dihydrodipicolinate reductase [Sediminispirochaeta smaragdinae DSM 11293]